MFIIFSMMANVVGKYVWEEQMLGEQIPGGGGVGKRQGAENIWYGMVIFYLI